MPTPEETVTELLEQGHTPAEIIAEAEAAISGCPLCADGKQSMDPACRGHNAQAGITWVDAITHEVSGHIDERDAIYQEEKRIYEALGRDSRPHEVETAGQRTRAALHDVGIAGAEHSLALTAAEQHRGHANETITNAQRRIAAAQDPALVDPAVARFQELKAAEAEALKASP